MYCEECEITLSSEVRHYFGYCAVKMFLVVQFIIACWIRVNKFVLHSFLYGVH